MGEESTRRVVASSRDATASPVSVHVDSWRPSAITSKMEPIGKSTAPSWNTRNLGLRLGADFTAAAAAGSLVAPIITIIDRYVLKLKDFQVAYHTHSSIVVSLKMLPGAIRWEKVSSPLFDKCFSGLTASSSPSHLRLFL